jgi:MFS transporter, DHA3 family, macrolide efflux protein
LLRRRDFRRTFVAVMISELGDAFQYIALMWIALETGGPLGVIAVRLADSLPALVFGFHGGVVADRVDRKRTMIASDVVRAAILVPVAVAGLAGELPLAALVAAAFGLTAATSYFVPAYGAIIPALVGRENVQQANGLVRATGDGLGVIGWALAALLLTFLPLSAFFALNALSFAVSALLLAGIRVRNGAAPTERPRIREGFVALRRLPLLAGAVGVLAVAVTISSGTWIVGVPELVRSELGRGAAIFSIVAAGYALGSVAAGLGLARIHVRRKAEGSLFAWCAYLPGYLLFAFADSVGVAVAAGVFVGLGQGAAWVLANSAAQEQVPDRYLGRVMSLVALAHRGGHATGLLLIAPLFAFVDARAVFAAAAVAIPLTALLGLVIATRRAAAAPAVA